ncbi:MAG: HNH endonuclease [Alphaproteobacteria bacterium]
MAVTDRSWFDHLRVRPDLAEVNFWSPSDRAFRALSPGELFLFKLHAPTNFIVGGGIFAHATSLPCSIAWESFGDANGAGGLDEMRARILRYRPNERDLRRDFPIGCRILTQVFFLEEKEWISTPESFSRTVVSFKIYDTDERDGLRLWNLLQEHLGLGKPVSGFGDKQARYAAPALVTPRLGQGAFRTLVTDIYLRRCAVTAEKTLPALEAAHIRQYASGGAHEPSNGILLRRDIHRLFDLGYVTVSPDFHFEVSRRIRDEFENGRDYYAMHGRSINVPRRAEYKPDPEALAWHNEHCFLGS